MTSSVMRRTLLALALLSIARAAQAQMTPTQTAVVHLENERTVAMTKADTVALGKLLADEVTYLHSSGAIDTKASMIGLLKSGELKYISIAQSNVKARTYGDVVILTGQAVIVAKRINQDQATHHLNFTSVWAKVGADWKYVAWQSTAQAAAAK